MKSKVVVRLLCFVLGLSMMLSAAGPAALAETIGNNGANLESNVAETSNREAMNDEASNDGNTSNVGEDMNGETASDDSAIASDDSGIGSNESTTGGDESGEDGEVELEELQVDDNEAESDEEGLSDEAEEDISGETDGETDEDNIDGDNIDKDKSDKDKDKKVGDLKENDGEKESYSLICVGEAYEGVISEEELRDYFESNYSEEELMPDEKEIALQGNSFSSAASVGNYLRPLMVARKTSVSFSYSGSFDPDKAISEAENVNKAQSPKEGDYIKANTIGYSAFWSGYGSSWNVKLTFSYTSTAAQEQEVDAKVKEIVNLLDLKSETESELQKVRNIHDYLIETIAYTNDGTDHAHSSHGALVDGKCVCQGYAGAFYRLAAEAGIGCRYITNTGHAWNIVGLQNGGGRIWYNIDVTWDDPLPDGWHEFTYFMKNNSDFGSDHARGSEYNTSAFNSAYPMSSTSLSERDTVAKLFVPAKIYIQKGTTVNIPVKSYCPGASYSNLSWNTSNSNIARIGKTVDSISSSTSVSVSGSNKDIFVLGQNTGNAVLTLKYDAYSATSEIVVIDYSLDKEIGTIPLGNQEELTLLNGSSPASLDEVTWKTSNASVATVTQTNPCIITAKKLGTVTITAETEAGINYDTTITVIPVKKITAVELDRTYIRLNRTKAESSYLIASITPPDTTDLKNVKYEWTVSDADVIKLESCDSQLSGTGDGCTTSKVKLSTRTKSGFSNVTCTVTAGGVTKSAVCKVEVVSDITSVKITDKENNALSYTSGNPLKVHIGETKRVYVRIEPYGEKDMYKAAVTGTNDSVSVANSIISDGYFEIKGLKKMSAPSEIRVRAGTSLAEEDTGSYRETGMFVRVLDNCVTLHDLDDGGNPKEVTIGATVGDKLINLYTPTDKPGLRFVGWYTEEGGNGTQVTADTVYSDQYDIYAYYKGEGELAGLTVYTPGNTWNFEYTGTAIKPQTVVFDGNRQLVLNKDYTVSYANNTNKYTLQEGDEGFYDAKGKTKAPSLTIKGKGNYAGSLTKYFVITPKSVSDSDVTVDESALIKVENKKAQLLSPTIKYNGKSLAKNKDFTITYPDTTAGAYTTPGVYRVKITGNGNYEGERFANIRILDAKAVKQVSKLSVKLSKTTLDYTGGPVRPSVTVKDGKVTLTENVDYTLTYSNDVAVGKAQVTVSGKGLYYVDSKTFTYTIKGKAISSAKVLVGDKTAIPAIEYNGDAKYQTGLHLQYKVGKEFIDLEEDRDYKLVYTQNTLPGTATITIIGLGGYDGKTKKTFKINPYDIAVNSLGTGGITIENKDSLTAEYAKSGAKVKPVIRFRGTILKEGVDYTLSYKNNKAVANKDDLADKKKPTVTIKGKGNFKGSINCFYSVTKGSLGECTMTVLDVQFKDKANNWYSKVTVSDPEGKALQEKKDYTIEYINTATGTVLTKTDKVGQDAVIKAIIEPAENSLYEGEKKSVTYKLVARNNNIAKDTTFKVQDQIFLGKEINDLDEADFTSAYVKYGKEQQQLRLGTDYEIAGYQNNTNKGNATVILKGKGNFCGTKKVTFKIVTKSFSLWPF